MDGAGGYLLGLDIGGTTTRALLAGMNGRRTATGKAEGANPNSHPPEQAAARVGDAIRQALTGVDPTEVCAGVLGLAGYSKLTDPEVRRLFTEAWEAAGLRCPMRVVPDSVAAFAAGTTVEDGTVLVAGTGSAAVRIEARQPARTVGGHGWLLGDAGSAYWLGRHAVQIALAALEEQQTGYWPVTAAMADAASADRAADGDVAPAEGFPDSVLAAAIGPVWQDVHPRRAIELLITAVHAEPPIRLARFAPLVTAAAERGSGPAVELVRRAVAELSELVCCARETGERTPTVLTGSLVTPGNPVGDGLRAQLDERGTGPVITVTDAAAGATWLAGLDVLGDDEEAAKALHRKLIG